MAFRSTDFPGSLNNAMSPSEFQDAVERLNAALLYRPSWYNLSWIPGVVALFGFALAGIGLILLEDAARWALLIMGFLLFLGGGIASALVRGRLFQLVRDKLSLATAEVNDQFRMHNPPISFQMTEITRTVTRVDRRGHVKGSHSSVRYEMTIEVGRAITAVFIAPAGYVPPQQQYVQQQYAQPQQQYAQPQQQYAQPQQQYAVPPAQPQQYGNAPLMQNRVPSDQYQ